jgi:antirestriction protein ArdC
VLGTEFATGCALIANWLDVLTADNRAIVAASPAQRAADFINGLEPAALRPLPAERGIRALYPSY